MAKSWLHTTYTVKWHVIYNWCLIAFPFGSLLDRFVGAVTAGFKLKTKFFTVFYNFWDLLNHFIVKIAQCILSFTSNTLPAVFCTLNLQKKSILAYILADFLFKVLLASCCKMEDSWSHNSHRWKDLSCIMSQSCEKSMLTHHFPFQAAGYRLFTAYNQHVSILHLFICFYFTFFFFFIFLKAYWLKLNSTLKQFYFPNVFPIHIGGFILNKTFLYNNIQQWIIYIKSRI